ncbi:promotilin [Rattus norvegicus]|uniref:Motilin n=2 Tax=Rattus norvegicus TaxID=10116 RepID=A8IRI0_RAT|nr:promotilin [Rattus norvegicus]BAF85821.1 motilin [Rattus norvegicus]|eukprot:NP_001103526.1 promotilin [Rattus norvegicus]
MVSCKAVVILLEVYAAAMLTSQIEAFLTIFVHGELQRLQLTAPARMGV